MAEELIGIIGGTGLGDALAGRIARGKFYDVTTPFGKPSDKIMVGAIGKRKVAFINRHGKGHKLIPSEVPYAANVFALKKIGVHTVIGTGAVGSLSDKIGPGDLVIVDQFIDKTFKRQNTFFTGFGAVHCEMAQPVCERLRKKVIRIAKQVKVRTYPKGTYICMEGPQFSTRAESLMHRAWGGDVIGMTAMPEAKLAREAQMCYCLIALASDYDCWRPRNKGRDMQTLLREITGNLQAATNNCLELIERILASDSELVCEDCACRRSLALAVWTNKDQIKAAERKRLAALFE